MSDILFVRPVSVIMVIKPILYFYLICISSVSSESSDEELEIFKRFQPERPKLHDDSLSMRNSAKLAYHHKGSIPDGVTKVQVQAKEVNDLTGDLWEDGYEYDYSAMHHYIIYGELTSGAYYLFRLRYGKLAGDGTTAWTQWSRADNRYHRTDNSRFVLHKLKRDWLEARNFCKKNHMMLATVKNEHDKKEILKLVNSHNDSPETASAVEEFWIGLEDISSATSQGREWVWSDHEGDAAKLKGKGFFQMNNLHEKNEPSCAGCTVVKMMSDGGWWKAAPKNPTTKYEFVCESPKKLPIPVPKKTYIAGEVNTKECPGASKKIKDEQKR